MGIEPVGELFGSERIDITQKFQQHLNTIAQHGAGYGDFLPAETHRDLLKIFLFSLYSLVIISLCGLLPLPDRERKFVYTLFFLIDCSV
ncbi:hypothetical protein [Erwinia piriflorinigrans]|uniref:hypothetical protein n=1 Tax=Erwinia piriflorinigrans TaxID=665097 RepID=UPI000A780659|nr:hypothetical protein [Erwinia piriflorinigrans]